MGVSKTQKRKVEEVLEEAAEAVEIGTPEKLKKDKKAKKAAAQADVVMEEEEVPAPKKEKKEKKAKKAVEEEAAAEEEEAPAPKKEKKEKKAKQVVEEEAADEDEAPAPKAKKEKKAKKVEEEDAEEEVTSPKAKEADAEEEPELTVFVGGVPFSCSEETLRKDFAECGEIEKLTLPMNEDGRPKGIAFIKYKTKEGVTAALKFDGDEYGGRTLKVNLAGQGSKGKGKGEKGKGKGNNEATAFVRGLPFEAQEDELRKLFADCGEIKSLRMPLNEEGKSKGIAFVEFTETASLDKAKEFHETEFGGRTIYVSQAGEGSKGKGKDSKGKGKDSKGKGKDSKGKSKGKDGKGKGKKGKTPEFEGKKQTFEDSDDE